MKRLLWLILLLLSLTTSAFAEEFDLDGMTLTVTDGRLTEIRSQDSVLRLDGLLVDVGCDGAYLRGTLGFQSFQQMSTWELAKIVPRMKPPASAATARVFFDGSALVIEENLSDLLVRQTYTQVDSSLALQVEITSLRQASSEIQGVSFSLRGMDVPAASTFRFPGNTPGDVFSLRDMQAYRVQQTDFCNPVTMIRTNSESGFNVLFLDEEGKWSTGLYRDSSGKLNLVCLPMVEGMLAPAESMQVGTLYLQLTGSDAYAPIQSLYRALGYHAPSTAYASGPMYAGHPAGTMDSGFQDTMTMRAYAKFLPKLSAMGIETVWLLPIFAHPNRGVYEPLDQQQIDPRYGTDADVRAYVEKAHEYGIRVLFDYVPHGPKPEDALAKQHPEWCAVSHDGKLQIEWDCVSFDMANPDYQAYTTALVQAHVERFGIDGGRIDCAMGGLSNWLPRSGCRASSSGQHGGQAIVSAIREGFIGAGKAPVLLPENFHPLPFYAAVTDVYYDMPLYRELYNLRTYHLNDTAFASALSSWLESEHLASVPHQLKLRFLGNHDTVSWTWDQMRPAEAWGLPKAKALWSLMAFLDGVPFLYTGDEDSSLYHAETRLDLTDFFSTLFAARKAYLTDDMDTIYLPASDAILAFWRKNPYAHRLVLVNLGAADAVYSLPAQGMALLYGDAVLAGSVLQLPAYSCAMLDMPAYSPISQSTTP